MSTISIEHAEPSMSVATWGSIVILVWRDAVEPRHIRRASEVAQKVIAGGEDDISMLHVHASPRMMPMDDESRAVSETLLEGVAPRMRAEAHVVPNGGFVLPAIKGAVDAMWEQSPVAVERATFDSIGDALAWLAARPDQDPIVELYCDQLATAIEAFVADVPPAHVPAAATADPHQARPNAEPCPNVSRCPMYPELSGHRTLQVFQNLYCRHDYGRCARYRVMKHGVMPDPRLLPNGTTLPT